MLISLIRMIKIIELFAGEMKANGNFVSLGLNFIYFFSFTNIIQMQL